MTNNDILIARQLQIAAKGRASGAKPNGSPSGLALTVLSDTSIKLDWTIGSTNQDGCHIYDSSNALVATVTGTTATKTLTDLTANTQYGYYVKEYKGSQESAASTIVYAVTEPTSLRDGNTDIWADIKATSTITKDGSNLVSKWADKLGGGKDLNVLSTGYPTYTSDYMHFNGAQGLQALYTRVQPMTAFIVMRINSWVTGSYICDGGAKNSIAAEMFNTSQHIQARGGNGFFGTELSFPTGQWHVLKVKMGSTSADEARIDGETATTGDGGTTTISGFTLGCRQDNYGNSKIDVAEVIVRHEDNATNEDDIANYLYKKMALNFALNPVITRAEDIISDSEDKYAHESYIKVKTISGTDYLFLFYISNKSTSAEWATTAVAEMKVFNLSTLKQVETFDVFKAGITAGITIPPNATLNVPRFYFYGNYVRCFCSSASTLYMRDIDISSSNHNSWTPGNYTVAQMYMKDADGNTVLADVTSANIQTHLQYVLGESNALYNGLMPMFRNMDIAENGTTWYATLEADGERVAVNSNISILLSTSDSGGVWSFGNLINYTTSSRNRLIEPSLMWIGSTLHLIARSTSTYYWHLHSTDNGVTWVSDINITLTGVMQSKPTMLNYTHNSNNYNVFAVNLTSEVVGNSGRTTLEVNHTTDFSSYTQIFKVVTATYAHYPKLFYWDNHLYISYTKGGDTTDRNKIALTRIF